MNAARPLASDQTIDLTTAAESKDSLLARLERQAGHGLAGASVRDKEVRSTLVKSLKAYKKGDYRAAAMRALDATRLDPQAAQPYHTLALALEALGELHRALAMYERAMTLDPKDPEVYLNLGLVAWKLRMLDGAEKFFRLYINLNPDSHLGHNNLGGVLRDVGRYDEAVEILRGALYTMPDKAELWNTLGTVAMEQGSIAEAQLFYAEALRLDPKLSRAYHNIGYALSHTGPLDEALRNFDKALKLMTSPADRIEAHHARALCLIGMGRLSEGFGEWEIRHDAQFRGSFLYAINAPRWQGEPLEGKRLLVMGEQGLGDEIMFSNAYPDLVRAVGPTGKLLITCDSRLIPLFQRSFSAAEAGPYENKRHNGKGVRVVPWLAERQPIDYYSTCGSVLRFLRTDPSSFPTSQPHLVPDAARVKFWRNRLEALGPGPYVGLCWRSMVIAGARGKYFSPIDLWGPVMTNRSARFINLQYGDSAADIARAREQFGIDIQNFDDLDLKNSLDDNAALCAALDLVISAPTAAGAIAGSVGTEVWLLTIGTVWPALGTDHFPWFTKSKVMSPARYADWPELMTRVGEKLERYTAAKK